MAKNPAKAAGPPQAKRGVHQSVLRIDTRIPYLTPPDANGIAGGPMEYSISRPFHESRSTRQGWANCRRAATDN